MVFTKMGWLYPDISLEDLIRMIKGFVDMLILASGYQSTGRPAHWDSNNIKRVFQWALFLEDVSKGLTSSDDYRDCVRELDSALSQLTSSPCFPQGLAPLSCTVLGRSRDLVLERLIHTLPLRESHLKAIMTASVEMDINTLGIMNNDCLRDYVEKLTMYASSVLNLNQSAVSSEDQHTSSRGTIASRTIENLTESNFSLPVIRELGRRQLGVSCLSVVETGLGILSETILESKLHNLGETLNAGRIKHSSSLIVEERQVEPYVWNRWRSRSLSYMLDKRTIRLVAGASLIFSAPKAQWCQMFERINISSATDNNLCEMIELLLLGCIVNRWSALVEHLMSVSYKSTTISRLHSEVFNLPQGKSRNLFSNEGLTNVKEKSVLDHLEVLLRSHLNQLWELPPVLAAAAIPPWSQLFRSYLLELDSQLRGHSLATRFSFFADAAVVKPMELSMGSVRWLREFGASTLFMFSRAAFGAKIS